jgi:hypothetical protein
MDDRRPAQAGAQNPAYRPAHPLISGVVLELGPDSPRNTVPGKLDPVQGGDEDHHERHRAHEADEDRDPLYRQPSDSLDQYHSNKPPRPKW